MSDWRIESGGGGRKKEVEGETGTRDDARSARTEKRRANEDGHGDETRRDEMERGERERERGTKEGESMIGSNACERRRGTVDQTSRTSEASVWNEDVSISRQIEPHVPAPLIFITASGPYLHESPHHRPTKRQLGIPESNVSRPAIYIYIPVRYSLPRLSRWIIGWKLERYGTKLVPRADRWPRSEEEKEQEGERECRELANR